MTYSLYTIHSITEKIFKKEKKQKKAKWKLHSLKKKNLRLNIQMIAKLHQKGKHLKNMKEKFQDLNKSSQSFQWI